MPSTDPTIHTRSVIKGLDRLYQVARLYGDTSHAGVQRAMDSLIGVVRRAFDDGLEINVTSEGLIAHEMESPESGEFWQACRDRQIASIRIDPLSTPADLTSLVTNLARKDAIKAIVESTGGRIQVLPVDLSGLATVAADSQHRVDWQGVVQSLGEGGEWSPEHAEVLNATAAPTDEVAAALRTHMRAATRSIKGASSPEHAEKLRKLRSFIRTLNPTLRRALIAQDSGTFAGAEDALADLADVLPLKEVLESLRQVGMSEARPSSAALRMFQQLARSCATDQGSAAELKQLSDSWRTNTFASDAGADALLVSIGELLQSVHSETYCPKTYLAELDKLGRQIEQGDARSDLPTPEETSMSIAEISAAILASSPDGLGTNRMLTTASQTLGYALQTGRHDTARDLIRAATRAMSIELTEETARETLNRLDGVAEQLVRSAHLTDAPEATLELLRTSGEPAIQWALAVLAEGKNEPNTVLWTFVHSAQVEHVASAIEALLADGEGSLPPLDHLCAPFDFNGKLWIIWPLVNVDDAETRRGAFRAIAGSAGRWPLRFLTRALSDSHTDIQMMALDCLGPPRSDLESRLLGGFIEGRGNVLSDQAFDRATQSLVESQDPNALRSLHTAFLKLMSSGTPSVRLRAAHLARVIKRRRDHPLMKDAWARWRFSSCRFHVLFKDRRSKVTP